MTKLLKNSGKFSKNQINKF